MFKIKNIRTIFVCFLTTTCIAYSCKKTDTGPSIDDYFLNYDIPEIPVDTNYVVGAFYYSIGNWNANIKDTPVYGIYNTARGIVSPPEVMEKQIDYASQGGIDYFLLPEASYNTDHTNFLYDSVLTANFIAANTSGKMKFAVWYNFNPTTFKLTNANPLEADSAILDKFLNDFEHFATFFKSDYCQKVNGKALIYLANANTLYSNDNASIYKALRARMSALGIELYIVGMQESWSPPARYVVRFKNCVDAVYHISYSARQIFWDQWYVLPQAMDQNWEYSRAYFKDNMNVDFVPNISPAYNWNILTPTSQNPNFPRTDSGKLYRTLCNVAKMNANPSTRLILIDSWNKWDEDKQLEPDVANYGTRYLDITKQEFKK